MEVSAPSGTSQLAGVGSSDLGTALRLISCSSARRVGLLEAAFPAPGVPDAQSERAYDLHKLSPLTPSIGTEIDGNQDAEIMVVQGARLTGSRGPATTSKVYECLARASEKLARADILSRPVVSTNEGRGGIDVVSTPVTARVSTSGAIVPYIMKRLEDMQRLGLGRTTSGPSLLENWGLAREEVQDLSEGLSSMLDAYKSVTEIDSSDGE